MSLRPSDHDEVVGLLGELSEQEHRLLLNRDQLKQRFEPSTSSRTAGLSNLERHLLNEWREEVAYVLRAIAANNLKRQADQGKMVWWHGVDRGHELPPVPQLEAHGHALRRYTNDEGLSSTLDSLELREPRDLLLASSQLVDTCSARLFQAIFDYHSGNLEAAVRGAEGALRISPGFIHTLCARDWIASSLVRLGKVHSAASVLTPIREIYAPTPSCLLIRLWVALHQGSAPLIMASAQEVDHGLRADHPALVQFCRLRVGERQPERPAQSRKLPSLYPLRLGPSSRKVADVFLG